MPSAGPVTHSRGVDTQAELQKMLKVLEEEYISIKEDLMVLRPKYLELHQQAKAVLSYSDEDTYAVFVANVYIDVLYGFAQEYCCATGQELEKFRSGRMTESLQHPCRKYKLATNDEQKRMAKLAQFCYATSPTLPSRFDARVLKLSTYSGFGGSKLIAYLVMYMFALLWPSYKDGKVFYKCFSPDVDNFMSYTNPANGYIESKLGLTNDEDGFTKLRAVILDSGLHPIRVHAFSKMDLQHLLCDTWGKRGLLKKCTCQDSDWEKWKFRYYKKLLPKEPVLNTDAEFKSSANLRPGVEVPWSCLGLHQEGDSSAPEKSMGVSTWRSRRRSPGKAEAEGSLESCNFPKKAHDPTLEHHNCELFAQSPETGQSSSQTRTGGSRWSRSSGFRRP